MFFDNPEFQSSELKNARGRDSADFSKKVQELRAIWLKEKSDSEELRLIGPIIAGETNPINVAIITDNLDYFKNNYEKLYNDTVSYEKALKLSCLCGSQKISEFLLDKVKADYSTDKYSFILSYVCASKNQTWAESIAADMAKHGKPIPANVYAYSDFSLIDKIEEIFGEKKPAFKI